MTEDFVSFQLASYNPIVSTWLGTAALRANIERELCREIEAWTAESAATIRFFTSKPIPGATPADYALREIFLHCGCVVIAQIHFYGQDITKPFVRVHAQSRAMTAAEIIEAARELGERFRVFTPQRVLFHSPQGGVDLNTLPGAEGDQRVFAGRIAELIALPRQKSDMQFDLQPGDPREYYDEYAAVYDAFWAARPALRGRVLREPIESLVECHETGRCLHARVGWTPRGGGCIVSLEFRRPRRLARARGNPRAHALGPRPGRRPPTRTDRLTRGRGKRDSLRHDRRGQRGLDAHRDALRAR